jgi:hypothetical protein
MHGEIIPRQDLASDQFKALGQAIDRWCAYAVEMRFGLWISIAKQLLSGPTALLPWKGRCTRSPLLNHLRGTSMQHTGHGAPVQRRVNNAATRM